MLAGVYSCTITDAVATTVSFTSAIAEPSVVLVTTSSNNSNCGNADGDASAAVTGGTAPYTYNWSNGATTQTIGSIAAGSYGVTVTDINGCVASASVNVVDNPSITVNAGVDQTVCAGTVPDTLNGSVATATGGTWTTTGSGVFDNANSLFAVYTPSAADEAAGSVTLILTSTGNGNCTAMQDSLLIAFNSVTVNAGVDQTVCAGTVPDTLNGSVAIATGGTWTTTGSGVFDNANSLFAVYTPSAADEAAGSVTLILTSTGNGNCAAMQDSLLIAFNSVTVNAGVDQTVCAGTVPDTLNGSVAIATGGTWTTTGSGVFDNANSLFAVYTPSAADEAAGSVTLILTSTGNGNCAAMQDSLLIAFNSVTVNAGVDQTVCAGTVPDTLNGSVAIATGGTWTTTGSGVFDNANSLFAVYTPSAADEAAGSVTLILTSTGNGNCAAMQDSLLIAFNSVTVNAGVDQTVCAGTVPDTLNGSVAIATGGTLTTTGSGVFDNANSLFAVYTPSAADEAAGSVTLILTSTGNGNCAAMQDSLLIAFNSVTVNAGVDQTVCAGTVPDTLNGSVAIATGGTWTTTGSGVFDNANSLFAVYTPSAADEAAGSVTLILTSTGNGNCAAMQDSLLIAFNSVTVNAGVDQTICPGTMPDTLNGSVMVATGGTWTTTGSGVFDNANSLFALYTPSAADEAAGSVSLILTSTGNGSCGPNQDTLYITFSNTMVISELITHESAVGTSDGSIDIAISGGTAPYGYSWSNSLVTEDIFGITAGSYGVTVTDMLGCAKSAAYNVTASAGCNLIVNVAPSDESAPGASDGAVYANVVSGTAPFTYAWNGGAPGAPDSLLGLTGGAYQLIVEDALSCTDTVNYVIGTNCVLTVTTSVTDESYAGASDGSATIIANGGAVTPYVYLWFDGDSLPTHTGLTAGTYALSVADNGGNCFHFDSVTVNVAPCGLRQLLRCRQA